MKNNKKEKLHWNYNPERHKKHYCIEPGCHNEISYDNWKYGNRRCKHCATKQKWKDNTLKFHFGFGKDHPNFRGGLPHCIDCGKLLGDYHSIRCKKCWYKFNSGNKHFNYKESAHPKCIECGKELKNFYANRCWKCYCKWIKNPKNHPNYIDGLSHEPYAKEFTPELKEIIRKRDNYECQNCGMTEEEHLIVNGQVLHIHHIDHNTKNSNEKNLITVCKSCNIRANYNRDYWYIYYKNKIDSMYINKQ
jgi:hypothetical protein